MDSQHIADGKKWKKVMGDGVYNKYMIYPKSNTDVSMKTQHQFIYVQWISKKYDQTTDETETNWKQNVSIEQNIIGYRKPCLIW